MKTEFQDKLKALMSEYDVKLEWSFDEEPEFIRERDPYFCLSVFDVQQEDW